MSAPSPNAEEQARAQLTEWERFLVRAWERGAGGKVGLTLLYSGFALPFIFNVVALLTIWVWIWPLAAGVTEKIAVLGFLFLVLNAAAYRVRSAANSVLTVMFLTRRRKRRWAGSPDTPIAEGTR